MMNAEFLEKRPEQIAPDPNEILTIQQAAHVLKVSYSHMLRLLRGAVNGMPPVSHIRAGRTLRVRRGALTQWIRDVEHPGAVAQAERRRL